MNQLQQVMQHLPMAINFAIHCRTYQPKTEGGAGYYFDNQDLQRARRENSLDYRDQQGNTSTNKAVAKTLGLTPTRTSELYRKYDNDWAFIYKNFGNTADENSLYKRVWTDHNGNTSTPDLMADHYQCNKSTIYKAFKKFDRDPVKAHEFLKKNHKAKSDDKAAK